MGRGGGGVRARERKVKREREEGTSINTNQKTLCTRRAVAVSTTVIKLQVVVLLLS